MKKPVVLIIFGGIVLGLIGAGGYMYLIKEKGRSPDAIMGAPTPTPQETLVTRDDPSGFTIGYPQNLTVNAHDEDKENYAHVEFRSSVHPGSITVWVKDVPRGVTDTASWGKKMATPSSAISFDTTLGEKNAQKILISQPEKRVIVGAVYDGVLWYIEGILTDDVYWQRVFDRMTSTFVFKPLPASGEGSAASPDTSVDEEEVLE